MGIEKRFGVVEIPVITALWCSAVALRIFDASSPLRIGRNPLARPDFAVSTNVSRQYKR